MIRFFTQHPTAANLLMGSFLLLGVLYAPGLLLETFPRLSIKTVQVQVVYPGATVADVERSLCRRIEDALDGIDNLSELLCEAREGVAIATAEMVAGRDMSQFFQDVDSEVSAISDFPEAAEEPVVEMLGRTDFVASLAITGIGDRIALKAYAEQMKSRMLRDGGIPKVEITGFSDHQFRIELKDAAARELGLTIEDVANLVSAQNVDLPAGEIDSRDGIALLRFSDERDAINALSSIVVASSTTGGQITLGDVATISDRFEDDEVETRLNGEVAAVLDIYKSSSDDTLEVMEQVRAFAKEERARAIPGVKLTVIRDSSVALSDRLTMLLKNSAQGILLVVAATWVFFGARQAMWIGMGLPVSFGGALALMALMGLSINMLSMVGLLIVVGILMDDSIVIAENISTKRRMGLSPTDAAVQGTRQVMPGVISSFLTTLAIFGPLAFIGGDIGEMLRVIPMVMILVLAVSLVEAFIILPSHLAHIPADEREGFVTRMAERGVSWVRERIVGPAAQFAVDFRYLTLGLAIMLFLSALSLIAGGVVKFEAFPTIEENEIEARIELAASARLEDTREVVEEALAALERVNDELSGSVSGGGPLIQDVLVRFNENSDAGTNGANLATINVDIAESQLRSARNDEILAAWRDQVPDDLDVKRIIITETSIGPAGRAIELRLFHDDMAVLERASNELIAWLAQIRGTYNLSADIALGKPEIALSLKDGAGAVGLNAQQIANQVRAAFNGTTADEIQVGVESYEIDVRLASTDRDSLGDLDTFTIETPSGNRVPLYAVADVELERGYQKINRIDGKPAVTVSGDIDTAVANANEVVSLAEAEIIPELLAEYPGLTAGTEGQNAEGAKTQASMLTALGTGLFFVFILLSFQFRSYAEPIVVMILIPFALIGALSGHLIMGINFTLPSTLGFISLAGIVVNDSILLVTFIKNEHDPSVHSVAAAAPAGAKARFRAILLTSVTTIAGIIPLLSETSSQAQILIPLVTSIGFGLLGTTFLIVFLVPSFYTILDDFGLTSLAAERRAMMRDNSDAPPGDAAAPAE